MSLLSSNEKDQDYIVTYIFTYLEWFCVENSKLLLLDFYKHIYNHLYMEQKTVLTTSSIVMFSVALTFFLTGVKHNQWLLNHLHDVSYAGTKLKIKWN